MENIEGGRKNGQKENPRGSHKNKELKKLVNRKTKQSEKVVLVAPEAHLVLHVMVMKQVVIKCPRMTSSKIVFISIQDGVFGSGRAWERSKSAWVILGR